MRSVARAPGRHAQADLMVSWTVAAAGRSSRSCGGASWPANCWPRCGASTVSPRLPPGACRSRSSRWPGCFRVARARDDPRRLLRAIRQFEMNHSEPLELEAICRGPPGGALAAAAAMPTRRSASRVARGGVAGGRFAQRGGSHIMKIAALKIDGYGVWRGLKCSGLARA